MPGSLVSPVEGGVTSLAASTGTPYTFVNEPGQLAKALRGEGLRIVEVRTDRESNTELHAVMRDAAHDAFGPVAIVVRRLLPAKNSTDATVPSSQQARGVFLDLTSDKVFVAAMLICR